MPRIEVRTACSLRSVDTMLTVATHSLAFVDMRLITSAVIRNFNVKAAPETTFESMTPFDLATIVPMSGECKLHLIKRED